MANTEKRNLGPSEVEQEKNAHEIFDETDDIEKYQPTQTELEEKQEKLDRGEELYTGFGFDGDRPSGDNPLAESLATDTKTENTSTHTSPRPKVRQSHNPATSSTPQTNTQVQSQRPVSNTGYKTKVTSESKEIPEQTKLIIEPNNGDFDYKHRQLSPAREKRTPVHHNPNKQSIGHHIDEPISHEGILGTPHIPADYELSGIHYSTDPRTLQDPYYAANQAYITNKNTMTTLPIKHHYKAKRKQNKKGLAWTKIALGVAVAAGVRLLFLGEEDDGPFWT